MITQKYVIRLDFFASLKGFFCTKMKYFGKIENSSTIFSINKSIFLNANQKRFLIGLSKLLKSFKYDNFM